MIIITKTEEDRTKLVEEIKSLMESLSVDTSSLKMLNQLYENPDSIIVDRRKRNKAHQTVAREVV
jgi:hypothetical protein